jgi:CheY-like chemotaxis protein
LSLLDLLYLEESHADIVIALVHRWCAEHGQDISSDEGKKALAAAVRLSKSAGFGCADLFAALTGELAPIIERKRIDAVLIVEDEPLIALGMEEILVGQGLPVEYCPSREEALKLLGSKTPAVAILDFHLKDGKATDIAAELEARNVPVIFCSGLHQSDIPLEFRKATWLSKPFDDEQLIEVVSKALKMRELHQQRGECV